MGLLQLSSAGAGFQDSLSTRVDGRFAIRPCHVSPRSTLACADALVDEMSAVGQALQAPPRARQ
jgi:hypothetical protein